MKTFHYSINLIFKNVFTGIYALDDYFVETTDSEALFNNLFIIFFIASKIPLLVQF